MSRIESNTASSVEKSLAPQYLGRISFVEMRTIQSRALDKRLAGEIADTVFFCEHPPTLTLGKRTKPEHLYQGRADWQSRGVEIIEVDRGGEAAFHGPGQLMIYPVVALRERGLGVRDYVCAGLTAISNTLGSLGLLSRVRLEPAGVWVPPKGAEFTHERKIASVGLRIRHGVSDHGFSLNVCGSLEPYQHFAACGQTEALATSISEENSRISTDFSKLIPKIAIELERALARTSARFCSSTELRGHCQAGGKMV